MIRKKINFNYFFYGMFCALLCVFNKSVFAEDVCSSGYDFAKNGEIVLGSTTFIVSEDGFCPSGYDVYSRTDDYLYPILPASELCAPLQHPATGVCTPYAQGGCPVDRFDTAVNNATFIMTEDGFCPSGYEEYTVYQDYMYPLPDNSILCGEGTYAKSGVCTPFPQGTCPNGFLNQTSYTTVWALPLDSQGKCPSGYEKFEYPTEEIFACDTYTPHVTSDTQSCLLMCDNSQIYTEVGTCGELCKLGFTTLRTRKEDGTTYVFPLYSTKQVSPSINVELGKGVCYVNLAPGNGTGAINVSDDAGNEYHTVE